MSRYFLSATGTGIGKTFVACELIRAARRASMTALALKPVISGWRDGDMESDTARLLQAMGQPVQASTIERISPWRFAAALTPSRAAALEGRTLTLEEIAHWCRAHEAQDGLTLIEGAGGVMAPLTPTQTMRDLMQRVGRPVILVTGSYLGSISHTLTALEALAVREIKVSQLIVNEAPQSDLPLSETLAGMQEFLPQTLPVTALPLANPPARDAAIAALIARL